MGKIKAIKGGKRNLLKRNKPLNQGNDDDLMQVMRHVSFYLIKLVKDKLVAVNKSHLLNKICN